MREEVEAIYRELGIQARVVTFIEEIARAYANAALVVARAGATTLAELCAIGRPSILIPFPFAADDHQAKNADALEAQGASICIRESELEVDRLAELIAGLLDNPAQRRAMARAARAHGRPDAAAAIVDDMMGWVGGVEPSGESAPAPESDPPLGMQYSGLAMAPNRPRRPVVVDGAVWE
jgi:UDP-N-acetylglucosamine--N-acetylmuramyl-(pentapeptide) pyrophosphoryl-undecaprenol N-acetylglucosamine transferase